MINQKELFHEPFQQSQKIDDTFVERYNKDGFKAAIEYLKSVGATKVDIYNCDIKCRINKWTQSNLDEKYKKSLIDELLKLEEYIRGIKIDNNSKFNIKELIIETKKGSIKVMQLSEMYPKLKGVFPEIESEKRNGKCFDYAYHLSLMIPLNTKLTTGYVYGYCDKSEYLHSWVEITIDNEEYVIDGTLNAIINKDGYYRMEHVIPINQISKDILVDDLRKYPIIDNIDIPLEVYYVFRDEIIKDLEKNKEIFKKSKYFFK